MAFPLPQPFFSALLAVAYYYFLLAGARTFEHQFGDDAGAGAVAQFSFLVTGSIAAIFLGFRTPVGLWNGIGALALLAAALALYEWARRTVRERRFHIAWSGEVPAEVCADGPYRWVRHPFYLAYMIAFLALPVALPKLAALAAFLFNVALYAHAARRDERDLAASPLAQAYARYKGRTGMFIPGFGVQRPSR